MPDVVTVVGAAALAGLGGLLVPRLVASLPEPDTEPREDEPPKPPYVDLAGRPHLALRCAVASALVGAALGATVEGWWVWVLAALVPVGVALGYIDWHTRLLPARIVLPTLLVVAVTALVGAAVTGERDDLLRAGVGLVLVRSLYWLLWRVRTAGMGYGDVRLAALLGGVLGHLGWGELMAGSYAPFLIFGLPGLGLALVRRDRSLLKKAFPFGPSMLVGAVVGVLLGPWVWAQVST